MKAAEFCFPYKSVLIDFFMHIYISTEKDQGDENFVYIWEILEVIYYLLILFIDIPIRYSKVCGMHDTFLKE